jgi:predicted CXXCH cytochrome family protein
MATKGNIVMKSLSKSTSPLMAILAGLILMTSTASVLAGVKDTKHNLGVNGGGDNKFSGTNEICVFCHTPHGADATAAVPLWNRALGGTTYTTYDSLGTTSLDSAMAPVGSVSIACLSCHDGTQAMDTLINEPGSGKITAFSDGNAWIGNSSPTGIADLGTNLNNDHPIGIQYGGGGQSAGANESATLKDPDFKMTQNAKINGTTVWWVDTAVGTTGTREKEDMQLYTRTSTDTGIAGPAQPFVECASCHDPHSTNATFLRIPNDNSDVCLACHTK